MKIGSLSPAQLQNTRTDSPALVRRVGVNSLWLFLARVTSQGLALAFAALVARELGEVGFGQYAFIASVVFVGNMITTFGMDTLLIREIAKTRTTSTLLIPAAFWIQIALSAAFIAVVVIITATVPGKTQTGIALNIYAVSLVPLVFYTIFSAILRAYERMDAFLALNVATSISQIVAALIVFGVQAGIVTLVFFLLLSQMASALLAAALCYRLIPSMTLQWRIPRAELTTIARAALPIAALVAFGVIYQRLGVLALPALAGDAATGWFSAAARIVEAFKIAPQAVLGALFPIASGWSVARNPSPLLRAPTIVLISFSALAALGVTLAARPLIDLIYTASFAPSAMALQILMWELIPYTFTAMVTMESIAKKRERHILFGNVVGLVVSAVLYLTLVPSFGLIGACWAAVISEWLQAIVFFVVKNAIP